MLINLLTLECKFEDLMKLKCIKSFVFVDFDDKTGNKSPVILKEEKPPLPPPEYQKAEDGADVPMLSQENSEEPYQPPPPFATNRDNNRQNRPKPTPTYRKPPPYVPP